MKAKSVSTASPANPQALPKIKKVLKPELPREYLRIQEEIRVRQMDLEAIGAAPKIKKVLEVLKPELVCEYLRIEDEIRLRQMDLDAVGEEIRLLVTHGYLPPIGEPEVWIAADGSIKIERSSGEPIPV